MTDAVKPCPNRECNSECYVRQTSRYWVQCEECEYSGPTAITKPEAIRLHNLICTPPAGWKPIETAPERKFVLVWAPAWGCLQIGFYHPKRGWRQENADEGFYGNQPTHWMPLPAAPENET